LQSSSRRAGLRDGDGAPEDVGTKLREIAVTVLRSPFTKRSWSELSSSCRSGVAVLDAAFVVVTMAVALPSPSRSSVGVIGCRFGQQGHRANPAERGSVLLEEDIEDLHRSPRVPVSSAGCSRPCGIGRWRPCLCVLKIPLALLAVLTALSVWVDAFECLTYPLSRGAASVVGIVRIFGPRRTSRSAAPGSSRTSPFS